MRGLDITFRWVPIQGLKDVSYCFPQVATKYLRDQYGRPGVYRWLVRRDQKTSVYIGETENLATRLSQYLKPGSSQATNKRIRAFLDSEHQCGARISLEVLEFDPFAINGLIYSVETLGTKETRCFLENLLITQLPAGVEKLNQLTSFEEKLIAKAALTLNPALQAHEAKIAARNAIEKLRATKSVSE